jgi:hypothetical protein
MVNKNNNSIKNYLGGPIFNPSKESRFDIMKDIPGTRIGDGSGVIGDYNNDGIEEIFVYLFGGHLPGIVIYGYDNSKDAFVTYLNIPFDLVDPENGPAPAEFMNYQGTDGVKIYVYLSEYLPVHSPNNIIKGYFAWYFFAWDEGSGKFVELAEIGEDIDYTMFTRKTTTTPENTLPAEPEEPVRDRDPPPVIPVQPAEPETPDTTAAVIERKSRVPIIGAASGLLALGVVIALVVSRKKRRR